MCYRAACLSLFRPHTKNEKIIILSEQVFRYRFSRNPLSLRPLPLTLFFFALDLRHFALREHRGESELDFGSPGSGVSFSEHMQSLPLRCFVSGWEISPSFTT